MDATSKKSEGSDGKKYVEMEDLLEEDELLTQSQVKDLDENKYAKQDSCLEDAGDRKIKTVRFGGNLQEKPLHPGLG